jgi:hypothetical protein
MNTIDLARFTSKTSMVLSGRERGVGVRLKLDLDRLDKAGQTVSVIIPQHIISLNSSFFQGLFGESVRTLGDSKFRECYRFSCSQVISEDVDKGIVDALNQSNPLG